MERMEANDDLMWCTKSFISDSSVRLIIDDHLCEETAVERWVPQGSPV